jgi:hypothetical protein
LQLAGLDALRRQVLAQASASSIALYQSLQPIILSFLTEKTKLDEIYRKSKQQYKKKLAESFIDSASPAHRFLWTLFQLLS